MASNAKKKKKQLSKDDLRRLMKETKSTVTSTASRIDSPLAKYNSLGHLSCALCNVPVKNEKLWKAHIQGRTHRELVASLKMRPPAPVPPANTAKRKMVDSGQDEEVKKSKVTNNSSKGLPANFFEPSAPSGGKTNQQPALTLGDYGSSDEEEEENANEEGREGIPASAAGNSGLPADFFDSGVPPAPKGEEEEEGGTTVPMSMADKLPEGFFDDAKMDAKVRKVEYRDKMEDEWESFQKAMKEETAVSAAIIEEEDESVTVERKIDEIDDQINRLNTITTLARQKEEVMSKAKDTETMDSSDSEADEREFEGFLDWRNKKESHL
ncbi:zinc finger protein 830 [Lingula anatina]|uniref:Zinc finger protein 830 n=1 Tax=Lingula anatina TaxID=7574 RepID=A0A1S3I769_LINAN|nr:zinc finger protein 830 [Lingula anatina]|eukprot:XP_013394053.1 zinc finger protein 830 [Lingula anatina]